MIHEINQGIRQLMTVMEQNAKPSNFEVDSPLTLYCSAWATKKWNDFGQNVANMQHFPNGNHA